MKKICIIIGARPQFIKHAPVELALRKSFHLVTIHTGQHYDTKMSEVFFKELNIATPNYLLNAGSSSHGKQTAIMLVRIEEILFNEKPDYVLVYGDTNSTLAGALAAKKLNIKVIHIEAGLRSFNKSMPEEINRILTDNLSDILFAPTKVSVNNLHNEGIKNNVFNVGDVMCDSIKLAKSIIGEDVDVKDQILLTIHRPYNTDNLERLLDILHALNKLGKKIIFPIHPRTNNILSDNHINRDNYSNINFVEPVSYFELIKLQVESTCIITDSGGVQKEAYILKRKCITLRSETEWVETLENGWNTLVFDDLGKLNQEVGRIPGVYQDDIYGKGDSSFKIADILNQIG